MDGYGNGASASDIGSAVLSSSSKVSTDNSTSTLLTAGSTFTGTWEDASSYPSVVVAAATDQNGSYSVQFSPDGVNIDSTLTRYFRVGQIDPPHRFTITRRYVRVTFTNDSASDQTYLRVQAILGEATGLNAPKDSVLAQDFDAIVTRPTDYAHEVALSRRQGAELWNKFGYNLDVGTSEEVLASWGGVFSPMTTARTLSIVSDSANDVTSTGTGARNVVIYGVDANRRAQTVQVQMNGLTPVVTTETWLGVNRIVIGLAGSLQKNDGTITATATTDLTTQGQIPAGVGSTQQCIFHIQDGHQGLFEWSRANVIRFGGGTEPVVTIKGWVYSSVSNARYEVLRETIDASLVTVADLLPPLPFPVTEASVFWLTAESTRASTQVTGRFTLVEQRNADTL